MEIADQESVTSLWQRSLNFLLSHSYLQLCYFLSYILTSFITLHSCCIYCSPASVRSEEEEGQVFIFHVLVTTVTSVL